VEVEGGENLISFVNFHPENFTNFLHFFPKKPSIKKDIEETNPTFIAQLNQ
jgi:hypothetical protein